MFLPIGILPKAWLTTEDFLKEKKPCQQNLFIISRIRFLIQFNNLKILLPNISIYYGKKTWSRLPILLVGVY